MVGDHHRLAVVAAAPLLSGWRYRALIVSVIVAAFGYLAFSLWGGWRQVWEAVTRVGLGGMCVALALSLANYGLRFIRWQRYLSTMGHSVPWWSSWRIYLSGFALTVTPGKAGEALRGVFLKPWGVSYPQSFAAFLSERLSDLTAILLLTFFGLSAHPATKGLVWVGAAGVGLFLLLLSHESWLRALHDRMVGAVSRIGILCRSMLHLLLEAQRCHAPGTLAFATLLSIAAWSAEGYAFHLLLRWLGSDVTLGFSLFVYAVSMLAGALSFLPGGLGGAEAMMVGLLLWSGMSEAEAVAATVLIRLATLWFAVALGVFSLTSMRGRSAS